jgi:glycosyltransferase involved in cell wall biosynthesis
MDLRREGRVLYITTKDISLPIGPSVNEREFCWALNKLFRERVHFLISEPRRTIAEVKNYSITYVRSRGRSRLLDFSMQQIEFFKVGNGLLSSKDFDLIISRMFAIPLWLFFLMRRNSVPLALKHLQGYPDRPGQGWSLGKQVLWKVIAPFNKYLFRQIAGIAVGADACTKGHIKGIMQNLGIDPNRVLHVENGTNTARFYPQDKVEARKKTGLLGFDPIVGYVGGRPWHRGGKEMVLAAPGLQERYPKVGFVIVGGGVGMDSLIALAKEKRVLDHFVFPGVVDYEDVADYINSFDVGIALGRPEVFTSVGNSAQKIRQYISCGKPVVSSPGGSEFILEHSLGSVVDSRNVNAVADAIGEWLALPQNEKDIHAKRARLYAEENFSIELMLKARVEWWNNCL